jgi:four helix bundle protein
VPSEAAPAPAPVPDPQAMAEIWSLRSHSGRWIGVDGDHEVEMGGNTTIRFDFERLEVFGVALDAVAAIDELVEELPEGRAYIRDQLRRAVNSIPLNVCEGAGEYMPAEKARFYRMARRSATESAGQLLVCRRLGLLDAPRIEAALELLQRVNAMLVTLVRRCGERAQRGMDATNQA